MSLIYDIDYIGIFMLRHLRTNVNIFEYVFSTIRKTVEPGTSEQMVKRVTFCQVMGDMALRRVSGLTRKTFGKRDSKI